MAFNSGAAKGFKKSVRSRQLTKEVGKRQAYAKIQEVGRLAPRGSLR